MTATRQVGSKSPDKLTDKFDTNNKYIRNLVKLEKKLRGQRSEGRCLMVETANPDK